MTICLVCNEFPPYKCGGIGIFSKELAISLISRGHQVIVIGIYSDIEEDAICDNGLRIIRMKSWPGKISVLTNRMRLGYRIKELVKSEGVNLVELSDFEGSAAFWPRLSIPIVTRLHGSVTYFSRVLRERESKSMAFLEKRSLFNSNFICSVSRYTADVTKQIFGTHLNIKVIHNGVNIPKLNKCKVNYTKSGIVSYSGSLMRKKGVFSLAKAWIRVKHKYPNAKLRLIGKDTLEDGVSVKDMILNIVEEELQNSVEVTGHISKEHMEKLLIESDVAVYPSYAEAFSLAPLEAMALKLPVIYSNRTSGVELANLATSVKLVDPDNIDELSSAICDLLADKALREAVGINNRSDAAQHFNTDKMIDETLSFYDECINGHNV